MTIEKNPAHNWKQYIDQAIKTGLESPVPYKVIPYKNGIGIKNIEFFKPKKIDIDNYEHLYFFEDIKGIWGEAKNPNEPKISKENLDQVKQDIKSKGIKFYTCDDDGNDKHYGYYYSICDFKNNPNYGKPTIDFEPMDFMSGDGHVQMWYLENKKWNAL